MQEKSLKNRSSRRDGNYWRASTKESSLRKWPRRICAILFKATRSIWRAIAQHATSSAISDISDRRWRLLPFRRQLKQISSYHGVIPDSGVSSVGGAIYWALNNPRMIKALSWNLRDNSPGRKQIIRIQVFCDYLPVKEFSEKLIFFWQIPGASSWMIRSNKRFYLSILTIKH